MIHKTDLYQIEYLKFLFFKKIRIFLLSFFLVLTGAFCMKIFTHAEIISGVEIGGLKYDLDTETKIATVTGPGDSFSNEFPDGNLLIPERIHNAEIDYDIKIVKDSAFKENASVTSAAGASIEKIENNAFSGCKNLAKITFKNAIYIGTSAFQTTGMSAFSNPPVNTSDVTSLTEVNLPKVKYVAPNAFTDCVKLTSVDLPEAIFVNTDAFNTCVQLQEISLPKVKVCGSAFIGCSKLEKLVLPELVFHGVLQPNATSYVNDGSTTQASCNSLKLVDFPNLIYCQQDFLVYHVRGNPNSPPPKFTLKVPKSTKSLIDSLTYIDQVNVKYYDDDKNQIIDGKISDSTELQAKIDEIMQKKSEEHGGISFIRSSGWGITTYSAPNMGKDAKYHVFQLEPMDFYEGAKNNFCFGFCRILESKVNVENLDNMKNIEYDGKEHKPGITVKDGADTLVESTDYVIDNVKNVGKVTLQFIGENYSGLADKTLFEITPKNASNFEVNPKEASYIYDSKIWKPEFTIKDNDLNYDLKEGTDYKIILAEDMKEPGVKKIKINYIGNYTGSKDIELEIVVDKSSWGTKVDKNGVINYVDSSGKTSTEVTGNEKIWLKEDSDNSSAWYAIDNSNGNFRKGSRFWVKWLGQKENKEEFEKYYNQLDDEHKNKVKNNNLYIFLTGVTDPDGNEYKNNFGTIDYYIQIGNKWDKEKINAVFIQEGPDENFGEIPLEDIKSPEGTYKFAKITMNHFSPYSVYEPTEEISPDKDSSDNSSADSNNDGSESNNNSSDANNNKNDSNSSSDENSNKNNSNGNSNWNNSKNQSNQDGYQYDASNIKSGLIIKISVLVLILLFSASTIIILKKSKFKKN